MNTNSGIRAIRTRVRKLGMFMICAGNGFPPVMHPDPLVRPPSDIFFNNLGKPGGIVIDVLLEITGPGKGNRAFKPDRMKIFFVSFHEPKNDGGSALQGQSCRTRWSISGPVKKINENPVGINILIDQEPQNLVVLEGGQNLPPSPVFSPGNRLNSLFCPALLHDLIESRVIERRRHHIHRISLDRQGGPHDFPIPEMSRYKYDSLFSFKSRLEVAFPFESHKPVDISGA